VGANRRNGPDHNDDNQGNIVMASTNVVRLTTTAKTTRQVRRSTRGTRALRRQAATAMAIGAVLLKTAGAVPAIEKISIEIKRATLVVDLSYGQHSGNAAVRALHWLVALSRAP
jgi:hypothetical protein